MKAFYPKILFSKLEDFLKSLSPETVVEMWVELCIHNNYDSNTFNWIDFENMVMRNPNIVGLDIEDDFNNFDEIYPLDDLEMDEKIKEYINSL